MLAGSFTLARPYYKLILYKYLLINNICGSSELERVAHVAALDIQCAGGRGEFPELSVVNLRWRIAVSTVRAPSIYDALAPVNVAN